MADLTASLSSKAPASLIEAYQAHADAQGRIPYREFQTVVLSQLADTKSSRDAESVIAELASPMMKAASGKGAPPPTQI
jgi:hypothetical protein